MSGKWYPPPKSPEMSAFFEVLDRVMSTPMPVKKQAHPGTLALAAVSLMRQYQNSAPPKDLWQATELTRHLNKVFRHCRNRVSLLAVMVYLIGLMKDFEKMSGSKGIELLAAGEVEKIMVAKAKR